MIVGIPVAIQIMAPGLRVRAAVHVQGLAMARVTRSGSARPQGGGWELAVWYGMRLTGLGLFVLALAHYLITHFLSDPASQNAAWIARSAGATSPGGPSTG